MLSSSCVFSHWLFSIAFCGRLIHLIHLSSSFQGSSFDFLTFFLAGLTTSILFLQHTISNRTATFTFLLHRHIRAQLPTVIPSHPPHVAHSTLPNFQNAPESDFPVNTSILCTRQGCPFTLHNCPLLESSVPLLRPALPLGMLILHFVALLHLEPAAQI